MSRQWQIKLSLFLKCSTFAHSWPAMFKWLAKETQTYLSRARDPGNLGASSSLLFKFASQQDLSQWNVFSDKEHGGKSEAELHLADDEPDTACFSGRIDSQLAEASDPNARILKRSGFAGMNSEEREYLDIDTYDHLVFRVKGDGRKYIASLRTDNWIIGGRSHDVWQAFLFARKGGWQEVNIPLDRFLLTWRGKLVDSEQQLNPQRIVSIGIALAGGDSMRDQGPFKLGLDSITAVRLESGLVENAREDIAGAYEYMRTHVPK